MDEKLYKDELDKAMHLFYERDFEPAIEAFNKLLDADNKYPHLYNCGKCKTATIKITQNF